MAADIRIPDEAIEAALESMFPNDPARHKDWECTVELAIQAALAVMLEPVGCIHEDTLYHLQHGRIEDTKCVACHKKSFFCDVESHVTIYRIKL